MPRAVECCDAVEWLSRQADHSLGHFITGIPDMNDVQMPPDQYRLWVHTVVKLCLQKAKPKAYVMFCQTDRKIQGEWFDKSTILVEAARAAGVPLRWHKIVLRKTCVDLLKPTYSHMLCFSRRGGPGKGTVDVIHGGRSVYLHGTPVGAVKFMCDFLTAFGDKNITQVVDPFVGRGTTLALAEAHGFDTVGVDLDPKQCEHANAMTTSRIEPMLNELRPVA